MGSGMKKEALTVITGSFAVTVGIILSCRKFIRYRPLPDLGIVSWVTENSYPIQSHLYNYALLFIFSIAMAVVFFYFWKATAFVMARLSRISFKEALRVDAVSYLFGVFSLTAFFIDRKFFLRTLPFFIALIFAAKPFVVICHRFLARTGILRNAAVFLYKLVKNFTRRPARDISEGKRSLIDKIFMCVIMPAAIYIILYNPSIDKPLDLYHEGEMLAPCQELSCGRLPYRDFNIVHGIGHNVWLPTLGLKLFGRTVEGYRRFYDHSGFGMVAPLSYVALYVLCLLLFRRKGFTLPAFLFLLCATGIGHLSPRFIFAVISMAFVVSYIDTSGGIRLFLAGACLSAALVYSSEIGTFSFAAVTLFLFFYAVTMRATDRRLPKRHIFAYAAGIAAAFLPFAVYLIYTGSFAQYIDTVFRGAILDRMLAVGLPFGAYQEEKFFPVIVYIVGCLWTLCAVLCRRVTPETLKAFFLVICGASLFVPALIRPDGNHISFSSFLAYIIPITALESFYLYLRGIFAYDRGRLWRRDFLSIIFCLAAVIAVTAWAIGKFSPKHLAQAFMKKTVTRHEPQAGYIRAPITRAGNILIPREQADNVSRIVSYIQHNTESGDSIYDFSNNGLFYFLCDRSAATRYLYSIYSNTPKAQEEVVKELAENKPEFILFEDSDIDGVKMTKRFYIIWKYVSKSYKTVLKQGPFTVFKKR